jgi:hypothetical protein
MPRYRSEITNIEKDVNNRFFQAIEALIATGNLDSLRSFCNEAGLTPSRYREIRLAYGATPQPDKISRYNSIELDGLYYLCKKYRVSAEWLLLGTGKMFKYAH